MTKRRFIGVDSEIKIMLRYVQIPSAYSSLVAVCMVALQLHAAEPVEPTAGLRSTTQEAASKASLSGVYLVRLADAAAASYVGGKPGLAATRPGIGAKLDRRDADVASYVAFLQQSHDELLAEIGAADSKIYSFGYALNGFAAHLTPAQASILAKHPSVERVWRDRDYQVRTNNSSLFLGLLDADNGLRANHKLDGEGVVIGVIDSGVATSHPSLADVQENLPRRCSGDWARNSWLGRWLCHHVRNNPPTVDLYDPPANFAGTCQIGPGFDIYQCNDKVVGARFYIDGFLARHELDPGEFLSPKDADGHGTHIATIIAGNPVAATIFGTRIARVSGIAPRAHIAVYKACWLKPGDLRATCTTADLARAIDDAVADGVDIINYSVGSLETDLSAPDDIALLNAFDAGVLSIVAAGNDGPELGTIGSPSNAPWVLTTAASTQTGTAYEEAIQITAPEAITGRIAMREANFTPSLANSVVLDIGVVLADDGSETVAGGAIGSIRDACEPLINDADISGQIALIERGACAFDHKIENAEAAGAVAAIVYNNTGAPFAMNGTTANIGIPAVMIGSADAQEIIDRLANDELVRASLEKGVFLERNLEGLQMSTFSSRGPSLGEADFLKPDVTAPGVDILAGHTRDAANGLRGQNFQYLSGTSMAAPETAGVVALLKQANPDWTPAMLKSALMTTAFQDVIASDGLTFAHPFEMGAGHIDGNFAIDPGLVYDSDFLDYAAYLCGTKDSPFPAFDCGILAQAGFSLAGRDVNLPSVGVTELISGDVIRRRVTNIGPPGTYDIAVEEPQGIDVFFEPTSLTLGTGESAEFSILFETEDSDALELDLWSFGRFEWFDGERSVISPMAVKPVAMRVPEEIELSGASGSSTFPVDYGYSGNYDLTVHGLNAPFLRIEDAFIENDTSNTFSFREGNGVAQHQFDVDSNDIYLRISTYDELTDGNDDIDLYLFYCPDGIDCQKLAESGSFTSEEQIDIPLPLPGRYVVLVHGFETDDQVGGPGALYSLFAWTFTATDSSNNLAVTIPPAVSVGDRFDLPIEWQNLDAAERYFGGLLHFRDDETTPYELTLLTAQTP